MKAIYLLTELRKPLGKNRNRDVRTVLKNCNIPIHAKGRSAYVYLSDIIEQDHNLYQSLIATGFLTDEVNSIIDKSFPEPDSTISDH